MNESINYSLKHLKKHKGRSFLTVFSILIGIATIFIFISFGLGLYKYVDEISSSSSADKVLITPQSAGGIGMSDAIALNDSDIRAIEKTPGVSEASGIYFSAAQVKQNKEIKYIFIVSYDPKKPLVIDAYNVDVEQGRTLRSGDINAVLLGYNYAIPNKVFPKEFNVNENIEVNGEKLKIVGFLGEIGNPQDDSQIYVTNEQYEKMYPDEKSYGEIFARVDTKNVERVVFEIERSLRKERNIEEGKEDFAVQSFNSLIESFSTALDIIIGFVVLIALISVLVSTINTANTMITSVLERYKEIGVLKAVGAKNSEIFKIFLFESSFLGLIAGILGCLLGWIVAGTAGAILGNLGWGFLSPYFPPYLFIGLILFAVLTGAVSGVLPAMKASKINTIDALRYE